MTEPTAEDLERLAEAQRTALPDDYPIRPPAWLVEEFPSLAALIADEEYQ